MKKITILWFLVLSLSLGYGCRETSGSSSAVSLPQEKRCLYFISRKQANEGIIRACIDAPQELIIAGKGIKEYALATASGTIAYIQATENGVDQIWVTQPEKEIQEMLISCEEERCENLAIRPDGSSLYFSRIGGVSGLFQIAIDTGREIRITSSYADWVDISPDGAFIRVHEPESGLVRILSSEEPQVLLAFPGDTDLIGAWNPDGTRFLMGERNVEGQLLVSRYAEISVIDQTRKELFTLPMGVEYFRPAYLSTDLFFVISRSGVRNNTRVISVIDINGEIQNSVTESAAYDHTSIQWNGDSQLLAYQRYDITRSDSEPEIVVWDQQSMTSFTIAENAVQPRWSD